MKYVYAAMLLHSAGQEISEDGVKKVLTAAGVKVEEARVKALVAALSEVDVDEVLKNASTLAMAPAAPAASTAATPPPAEGKAEAKEEKKKEEEALEGLGALFG